jgi:site-specific DNA-methyltransferase (adenine-specific)
MGSGTTGVACMNIGRIFIGIEREATYFKIANDRIKEAFDKSQPSEWI